MSRAKTARRIINASLATALAAGLAVSISASPAGAAHGSANLHWPDHGYTNARIYFHDMTGSQWPVGTTISRWNTDSGTAEVIAYWVPDGCPTTADNCVDVDDYTASTNPAGCSDFWYGCTLRYASGDHMYDAAMWLNNSMAGGSSQNRSVACHEEGHVYGLAERSDSTATCMWFDDQYFPQYPSPHDTTALQYLYDHSS